MGLDIVVNMGSAILATRSTQPPGCVDCVGIALLSKEASMDGSGRGLLSNVGVDCSGVDGCGGLAQAPGLP